jgi:hypothetical protein
MTWWHTNMSQATVSLQHDLLLFPSALWADL